MHTCARMHACVCTCACVYESVEGCRGGMGAGLRAIRGQTMPNSLHSQHLQLLQMQTAQCWIGAWLHSLSKGMEKGEGKREECRVLP